MSEYDYDLSAFNDFNDQDAWSNIWDFYPDFGNYTIGGQNFQDWFGGPGGTFWEPAPPYASTSAGSAIDRWLDGLSLDTDRNVLVDAQGNQVTNSPAATRSAMDALRAYQVEENRAYGLFTQNTGTYGGNPPTGQEPNALRDRASEMLASAGSKLVSALQGLVSPQVLQTLLLGGLGLGASRLITGGSRTFNPPAPPAPPASQSLARNMLNNALNTPPGGAMPGMIPNPFANTGAQNLEAIFRNSLAGQSILSNLAAMQALRESGYDAEQAPIERQIRLGSLMELPQYMYSRPPMPGGGPMPGPGGTPPFNQARGGEIPDGISMGGGPYNQQMYGGAAPFQMTMMPDGSYGFVPTPRIPTEGVDLYAGAPPTAKLGIFNRPPTHDLSIFDQAPTHNIAGTGGIDRSGRLFSRGIADIMGNVGPDGIPRTNDPIRAALEAELMTTMGGGPATPEIARQEQAEEAQLRNTLYRSLGAGYETSTPGIQALQELKESQAVRRDQERMQRIGMMSPQELARRQFEYAAPLNALSVYAPNELARGQFGLQRAQFDENTWLGRTNAALNRAGFDEGSWLGRTNAALNRANFDENTWQGRARLGESLRQSGVNDLYRSADFNEALRQRGLAERMGLLGLGRQSPMNLQNSLSSMVPISPLLGLGDNSAQQNYQNSFQAALAAFQAQEQERARLAGGISGLFGAAAGANRSGGA